MSDLDAEQTDIRPLLALIERDGGRIAIGQTYSRRWEAVLEVLGEDTRGWIGLGDTPGLAVASLVKVFSDDLLGHRMPPRH